MPSLKKAKRFLRSSKFEKTLKRGKRQADTILETIDKGIRGKLTGPAAALRVAQLSGPALIAEDKKKKRRKGKLQLSVRQRNL